MPRPCITGRGKKQKKYQRTAVAYADKNAVLEYIADGHDLDQTIAEFYDCLDKKQLRAKKQINKWVKTQVHIRNVCASGRGTHLNSRHLGDATVLPKDAEQQIVLWVNTLRKDGAPVSRSMLTLQAKEVAADKGLGEDKFAASATWVNLFLRRHKMALRTRTRQGQTTPADAHEAAIKFKELVLKTMVEKKCTRLYNADQTAVFFEYLPKKTISARGSKTVWIKCGSKDKVRATAMLLGDSEGNKYEPFIVYKSFPAKSKEKQDLNNSERNGFGVTVWREIQPLQIRHRCRIFGNQTAWWNFQLSLKFLKFHFGERENFDENVILLWDDFSGHWTPEVVEYAAKLNVVLIKVPPQYTYVCQPADIAWNQPLKSRLREKWVNLLRLQLIEYRNGDKRREQKQKELSEAIAKNYKEQSQQNASVAVAELRAKHTTEVFTLKAPGRPEITEWISSCWYDLTATTIVSGFDRVGLTGDTRVVNDGFDLEKRVSSTVDELTRLRLVVESIDSDDDFEHRSDTDE